MDRLGVRMKPDARNQPTWPCSSPVIFILFYFFSAGSLFLLSSNGSLPTIRERVPSEDRGPYKTCFGFRVSMINISVRHA